MSWRSSGRHPTPTGQKRRATRVRSELAHVGRVVSLGALTASIAHEVNQPLASIITNGETGLRWLAKPEPDLEKLQRIYERIVDDARRAAEIIDRIRTMASPGRH